MNKIFIITSIALLLCLSAIAQVQNVAIFDPIGGVEENIKKIVFDEVYSVSKTYRDISIIERQVIIRTLAEKKFRIDLTTDDAKFCEIGKAMKVSYIFVITISDIGKNNFSVSCKAIDVTKTKVLKQISTQTRNGLKDLENNTKQMMRDMLDALETTFRRNDNNQTTGGQKNDIADPKNPKENLSDIMAVYKEEDAKGAKAQKDKELAEAQAKKERELAEAQAKKDKELAEAQAKKERELAEAKAKQEREMEEARAQKEREFAEATARQERELAEAKKRQERELAEAQAQKERELAEARARQERELAEAQAQKEKELAEARAQQERELAAAKAQKEKEIAEAKAQQERELAAAKAQKEKEIAQLQAEKERELAEAKIRQERELAEAQAKANELAAAKAQKEKELALLQAQQERELAEAKARQEKEIAETQAKEKELAEVKAQKEKELALLQAQKDKELAEAKAQKEKELAEARAKQERELEEAKAKERELAEARIQKERELEAAKAQKERELAEVQAQKERELAAAQAQKERELAELQAQKERELAEARARQERELAEAKAQKDKEIAEAKKLQERELAAAKEQQEKEIAEAKAKEEKRKAEEEKRLIQEKAKIFFMQIPDTIRFNNTGGKETFTAYYCKSSWNETEIPSWCSLKNTNDALIVTCDMNSNDNTREGYLYLYAGEQTKKIWVSQIGKITLSVSLNKINFDDFGGKKEIFVHTNASTWKLKGNSPWCSLSTTENKIVVDCSPNGTSNPRDFVIEVLSGDKSEKILISQKKYIYIALSDSILEFPSSGGNRAITVNTNASSWNTSNELIWCPMAKSGNSIVFSCRANLNTTERSDQFTIVADHATKIIQIKQKGITCLEKGNWKSAINKVIYTGTTNSENAVYKGERSNKGIRNGLGAYFFIADSESYWGDFLQGESSGKGIYIIGKDGDFYFSGCKGCKFYVGNWSSDMKNGLGKCYDRKGDLMYFGYFQNEKPIETFPQPHDDTYKFECLEYDNGDMYLGETFKGFKHGLGIFFWANGAAWYGEWKDGQRDGRGIEFLRDGSIKTGRWSGDTYFE